MERLWSYLRRFSRMTKEMRPSHRIDVLSDAIIYYRQKTVNNIGNVIHTVHSKNIVRMFYIVQFCPLIKN